MKKLAILFLSLGLVFGCTRNSDTLGPNLSDIYGDFAVITPLAASTQTVDFSNNEQISFSAEFSKTVDWEIHIVGQSSGAEKVITGKSRIIDNTLATWNGTTSELPMFKDEICAAYVVAVAVDSTYTGNLSAPITVAGTRAVSGFVVADFENGINPGWTVFKQSGANMSFNIVNDPKSAQGGNYYDMGGEVGWDYLIGLIDFPATAYGDTTFPLSQNPNNVYFNVFLNKPAAISNEIVLIRFFEDDNMDGVFTEATEDMYALELQGLETGWQQISIRYADLVSLVNGQPANPNGNGVREPHKLRQVSVLFLADPATGYSQTLMDYLIFTENGPLEP